MSQGNEAKYIHGDSRMNTELKERCKKMISELGIPVTRFCVNIQLSTHTYYLWQNGRTALSKKRTDQISNYLKRYGF